MPVSGTRSRASKRVTLPSPPAATKRPPDASEAADSVSKQLTKLLAATEEQASLRSKENYDQVDRRCTEMQEQHAKSLRDLQNTVEKVQKAVKQLSEQREVQHSGKSGSIGMQALEQKVSRLSEREETARAEAQERVFRLQSSVAGLVTRFAAAERVVQRFDALDDRVASIEREMGRNSLRREKERSERLRSSISVDLSESKDARPADTDQILRGILKWPGRATQMVDTLSSVSTTMPVVGRVM